MALETAMAATARIAVDGHQDAACLAACSALNASNPCEKQRSIDAVGLSAALWPLRPHQERGLNLLRNSLLSGRRRPMVQLPTGAGKTRLAAEIIRGARAKGKRVAFVVPALSLVDQTVAAFEAEGIHCIGVMQGIHERTDRDQPVQICSVQTLARRKRPEVDLVIVDEAHQLHREIFRWMKDCPNIPFIGLSATPWSRGLGKFYDDLIVAATTADLIRDGFLSQFKTFAPSEPDLAGVNTVAGDFHEGELADAMDRPVVTGDIVDTWIKRAEGRSTFCFCVNRRHAQHVAERFVEAGVATEYMDGTTAREDREAIFNRFRSGETRIICNVGVLTTGIDLDVRSVILARPTKSRILFVQTIGRGLRTAEGKDHLLILDHAGNHLRLGMVTDISADRLDDGRARRTGINSKRERSERLPKRCDECQAVVAHGAKACPSCGVPIRGKTEVESAEGELVEFGSRRTGAVAPSIGDKVSFYGEVLWIARERGHKPGWVGFKFKERFGVWPNDPRVRSAIARPPGLKTRNWITSRQIAFAKARARGLAAHG
jgi:DNA repair protein RadD